MIIQPNSENDKRKQALLQEDTELTPTEASGSNVPPPPFAADAYTVNEAAPLVHNTSDMELGPPPEFAPYQAEQIELSNQDVVSHDPHLNFDGEALYRFLLSQSQSPPTYRVHCCGKHDERRTRWVTERDSHGHSRNRSETYSETVVDFDFFIDVLPEVPEGRDPITWSVSDDEPAYRGKMVREYEGSSSATHAESLRQKATRKQLKNYKGWATHRSRAGFPPWIRQEEVERGLMDISALSQMDGLKSSKSIRQWADEYCASPKYLKEFVYEKVLYGWDIGKLEVAIRSTIKSVPYNGSLTVDITPRGSKVYIRPDNKVSRMLSNMWLKFLSIILLVFPFIWLYKRFHSRGGGRWEVCGGAYPLKQWVPLDPGEEIPSGAEATSEELPTYSPMATGSSSPPAPRYGNNSSRFIQTPSGPRKLVGIREGQWFRAWESTIRHAVIGRYQSNDPLLPHSQSRPEVELLDGYSTAPPLIEY